jgi:phage recombination protein Bet
MKKTTPAIITQPTSQRMSALNIMATKFSVEPDKLLGTLKSTVFKGATNEELLALVVVSNSYGLNPLTKEIYAFPAKGGGIAPIVSIDGWIRMTNDHPQFDGMELDVDFADDGKPESATCRIFRKDRTHPTSITEYFAECCRNTDPWKQYPARMLRHKALIQCARVAFGFSGVYDEDEARDIAKGMRNVTPTTAAPASFELPEAKEEPAPATPLADMPEASWDEQPAES